MFNSKEKNVTEGVSNNKNWINREIIPKYESDTRVYELAIQYDMVISHGGKKLCIFPSW